jgi:hypothetical protein
MKQPSENGYCNIRGFAIEMLNTCENDFARSNGLKCTEFVG